MLRPHLPEMLEGSKGRSSSGSSGGVENSASDYLIGSRLVDLNERCRVLCYTPGQETGCRRPAAFPKGGPFPQITSRSSLLTTTGASSGRRAAETKATNPWSQLLGCSIHSNLQPQLMLAGFQLFRDRVSKRTRMQHILLEHPEG